MDNPLFGADLASPAAAPGGVNNPVWSAARGGAAAAPASPALAPFFPPPAPVLALPGATPGAAAAAAAAAMGMDRPEEADFADALGRLVRGEADAAETIAAYADICRARAAELRDLSSSQLQRAPRAAALRGAAEELEAEAATWQLLWFLHGVPGADFPAGRGGDFVEGAGFAKTYRQLAADLLFQDPVLNRAGRAVAWLEAAAAAADPDPEQGLARKDGVWAETRGRLGAGAAAAALGAGAAGALVTALDPDATTRQGARLDGDNTKDEERLGRIVWRLVRGGRVDRAAAACSHAGQPWRAASLGGGGPHGPLPLGAAAEEADGADGGAPQAEALAAEVEAGPAALRALWRWGCYQAAERCAATAQATGAGPHEAAVFAVLSSHLTRALPACATWEDALWVHLRCWLEASVDAELSAAVPWEAGAAPAEPLGPGAPQEATAAAAEGLAAAAGGWPLPRVRDALPPTFEEAVEAGGGAVGGAPLAAAGAQRFRRVQLDLILDRIEPMVSCALVRWIIDGAGASGASPADGPACPPGLMRFAAHLALALWALGIAPVPQAPDPLAAFSHLHDLLQRLVQIYAVHLIDSGAHGLVPSYACHLRAGLRRATYLLFLEQLLAGGDVGACRAAYAAGAEAFAALGPGDVEEDEMGLVARKAAGKAQMEAAGGPLQRARSLLWLCLDPGSFPDAVRWSCVLCREFALGGACGAAGALALLGEVVPVGVGGEAPLEALCAGAEAAGAAAEAAELRAWARFFELEAECGAWEEVHAAAAAEVAAAGEDPAGGALAELAADTAPLLAAAVGMLREGACPWLAADSGAARGEAPPAAGEIAIVVGPELGGAADPAVLSGEAYPTFAGPEEQAAAAAAAAAALQAAAGASPLAFHAGPAPEEGSVHLPGLVSLAVDCGEGDAAAAQAAALLSLALKGSLRAPDGAAVGPLAATNVSAAPAVMEALCRAAVFPRVTLRAAALRQALAAMGHVSADGSEGAAVLAAVSADATVGLFSPEEAREVKAREAAAAAAERRHRTAAARDAGDQP